MYNLNITNNFRFAVTANGTAIAANGGTDQIGDCGNVQMDIPGMGNFVSIDLGEHTIPGYPLNETWGVLFRYKTDDIYARYEGQGQYDITVDEYGGVTVKPGSGHAIVISLTELTLDVSGS